MECSAENLELLEELNALDFTILNLQRTFDTLPQRQAILKARQTLADLRSRKTGADELVAKAKAKVDKAVAEDESLAQKEAEIQALLNDKATGYRDVEARTKELAGIAKRRETINHQLIGYRAELAKVQAVADKVSAAVAQIEAGEAAQVADFKAQGTDLMAKIANAKADRAKFAPNLPADLLQMYEKTAQRCGGVGLAHLDGHACSVCRASIDEAHLYQLRYEAPLSACPHCKRLMIVKK